jgi:hypothetical protein
VAPALLSVVSSGGLKSPFRNSLYENSVMLFYIQSIGTVKEFENRISFVILQNVTLLSRQSVRRSCPKLLLQGWCL